MMPSDREERRSETYHRDETRHEDRVDKSTAQIVTGGSTIELIAGAGAATLGVLGLAGMLPVLFVTISCIAIGGGLMFAGGSIAAKYQDILGSTGGRHETSNLAETGGGISAETIGGAAGAALGILALVGIEPAILTSVAIIVLGGALMFGAGAVRRLSDVIIESSGAPAHKQRVASESVKGAAAMQTVCGLAALALGILTLVGIGLQVTLNLVAVIVLGAGLLLSGMAVGGKMINMLYKRRKNDGHHTESREVREYHHEPEYRSAE
jgi:hypothetical protein